MVDDFCVAVDFRLQSSFGVEYFNFRFVFLAWRISIFDSYFKF